MTPALKAFLNMLAWSEGTSTSHLTINDGYDVIVTGVTGPEVFIDYSDHPFAKRDAKLIREGTPPLYSTAAGRYQLLYHFWLFYKIRLGLPDYSPASQDAVAIQQIRECRAVDMVTDGNIQSAIWACSNIWASLPGNTYGQGHHSMETLLGKYDALSAAASYTSKLEAASPVPKGS